MMRLPNLYEIRFGVVGITAICACLLKEAFWDFAFAVFSSHYVVATYYAVQRRSIMQFTLACALALSGAIIAYLGAIPLLFVFGIHHLVTEVRVDIGESPKKTQPLEWQIVFHLSLYGLMLYRHPWISWVPTSFWAACVVISALAILRKSRSSAQAVRPIAFAAGLCILRYFQPVELIHITLYHAIFWIVYPLTRARLVSSYSFLGLNLLTFVAFFLLTRSGGALLQTPQVWLEQSFVGLALFHIFLTLFLSVRFPKSLSFLRPALSESHKSPC